MRISFVVAAILSAMSGCTTAPTVSTGVLGGSKYVIAVPANWNGNLLLLAHGFRPPEAPQSTAELDITVSPYKKLLEDGWIVASTSYRRNGVIVRDAAQDVEGLRQHVATRFGRPKRTFLMGWSMGGAIAVMLAETRGSQYQGMVVIGEGLGLQDGTDPYPMTCRPQTPLLFLSNQNELNGPSAYARRAAASTKPAAVWTVKRDGHCNVSGEEMRAPLDALVAYTQTGRLERQKDITMPMPSIPSVAVFKDGRAYAKVTRIGTGYGNLFTQYVQADLARMRITPGSYFVVGRADKNFKVLLAKQFGDVPAGQWVAFFTADGILEIARNFANAAKELACAEGDEIYIASPERATSRQVSK